MYLQKQKYIEKKINKTKYEITKKFFVNFMRLSSNNLFLTNVLLKNKTTSF